MKQAIMKRLRGRMPGVKTHIRATAELLWRKKGETRAPAGEAVVEGFLSTEEEDRGGVILKLTHASDNGFEPYSRKVLGGVEIHLCGQEEALALLVCLAPVIAALGGVLEHEESKRR